MDIIDQIIQKRKEMGVSQQQLAYLTGILQPVIARIESKKSRPTIDFIQRILTVLDLKLSLEDTFYCPNEIMKHIKGLNRRRIYSGRSNNKTYIIGNKYVLKISNDIEQLRNEKEKTDWLNKYSLASKTVKYIEDDGIGYYLRTCLNGHTLIEKPYLNNPSQLISILKNVINTLRRLDKEDCPFASKDNEGDDFVHGDLCLPNIVVDNNGKLIGFIDLSNAGKGDKEYDYSWLLWSFEYNLKTKDYSETMLSELGITIDAGKYLKYTLPGFINGGTK